MKEVKTPKKPLVYYYCIVLLIIFLFNILVTPLLTRNQVVEVDYGTFMDMIEAEDVGAVQVEDTQILFTDKDGNIYETTVTEQHEDYLRPQENSSHFGCSHLAVANPDGGCLEAVGDAFSFNTSRYTQEELAGKAHNYELEPCGSTVLCLDYKLSGIGSNSCGPKLLPQYRLEEKEFDFTIELRLSK